MSPFGPYYYRHWRAEGRQQTEYFGRKRPEGFPDEDDIAEVPEARPVAPLSALGARRWRWRSGSRWPTTRLRGARSAVSAFVGCCVPLADGWSAVCVRSGRVNWAYLVDYYTQLLWQHRVILVMS
jgi:hypothetical protein